MGKTSPIVIPVTVDTTGVDRGMSNVRSRLGRGGGRGTGGGFGTGGNNSNGVGQGGSGGGAISAAVAGAVAGRAVAGRRGGGGGSFVSEMSMRREFYRKLDVRQSMFDPTSSADAGSRYLELELAKNRLKANSEARARARRQERLTFEGYATQRREVLDRLEARRQAKLDRAKEDFFRGKLGLREAAKYGLSRLGVPEFAAGRIAMGATGATALGGLGIGAAIVGGAAASRFQQAQYQRFSNFQSYEGTPYYGIARRAAMGYDKSAGISWYDKMMMREKEAGGAVSGFFESVGGAFSSAAEAFGSFLGGAKFEPPKAWSANVASGQSFRIKN